MANDMKIDPMLPRRFRVSRAWDEMPGVATMELEALDGDLPPFLPGQFNMLYPFGIGEAAISIAGDPATPGQIVHTTRNVGKVSAAISALREGDMVGVRGPFGSHWPVADQTERDVIFIAGGLGLPPLRPAIYHVLSNRSDFRSAGVIYGARSPDTIVYPTELLGWMAGPDIDVEITVDHAGREWAGRVGVVTTCLAPALAGKDPSQVSAFVCGPEVMMRFACLALVNAGVSTDRIWLSMERNMKCAIGSCGHCQWGPHFVCRDGPVFRFSDIASLLRIEEV